MHLRSTHIGNGLRRSVVDTHSTPSKKCLAFGIAGHESCHPFCLPIKCSLVIRHRRKLQMQFTFLSIFIRNFSLSRLKTISTASTTTSVASVSTPHFNKQYYLRLITCNRPIRHMRDICFKQQINSKFICFLYFFFWFFQFYFVRSVVRNHKIIIVVLISAFNLLSYGVSVDHTPQLFPNQFPLLNGQDNDMQMAKYSRP